MSTAIKWDLSEVDENGSRVRTIAFQDHVRATPLVDVDNKVMNLSTWEGGEKIIMAVAVRTGRRWSVKVNTKTGKYNRRVELRDTPVYEFNLSKAQAIDFMCDHA